MNVLKSKICTRHVGILVNRNVCAAFFCFLFVSFLQTGNFLCAQTSPKMDTSTVAIDSSKIKKTKKVHPTIPWKAALMSGIVPGLGQIYNRKYWKLPIVWGALGVTGYFLVDQHVKYIGYRDAYRSWVNDSIMLPGYDQYQYNPSGLKSERDNYERNRNVLTIVAAALWALNIVDAAVDAHLSTFDVSPTLTMKVQPATFFNTYQNQPGIGIAVTLGFK